MSETFGIAFMENLWAEFCGEEVTLKVGTKACVKKYPPATLIGSNSYRAADRPFLLEPGVRMVAEVAKC